MRGQVSPLGFHPSGLVSAALLIVALIAAPCLRVEAQTAPAKEYRAGAVHAVFLVNFIRFTEWPAGTFDKSATFKIGVAGSRLVDEELSDLMARKNLQGRPVHVVQIKTARDLEGCHALYIGPGSSPGEEAAPSAEELLPLVRDKAILTVSESPIFLSQGGLVNLYPSEGGNFRFEIAAEAGRRNGLTFSSQLLALARIVNPPSREPSP